MGFMDMFKPAAPTNQPQNGGNNNQQQYQNNNNNNQQGNNNGGNGNMQGPGTMPGQNQQGQGNQNNGSNDNQDPLAAYSKLWENAAGGNSEVAPVFNLDPKILNDVTSTQKFTEGVNPELVQRATSGDMNAMMEVINSVAQNAYKASLSHGSHLTGKFVEARSAYDSRKTAPQVKSQLVSQALSSMPNYNHPAVKKQVDSVAEGIQRQNPDATPDQVAKMTKEYFTAMMMATGLIPASNQGNGNGNQGQGQQGVSTDWENWLSEN